MTEIGIKFCKHQSLKPTETQKSVHIAAHQGDN